MIKILMIISLQFASAEYRCTIDTGATGKIRYRATTHEDAMYKTVRQCLRNSVREYIVKRQKRPTTERRILFLEYCGNNVYCKEYK